MMTSLTTQTSAGPALEQLERLDAQVDRVFLARQHPITGLMPASTANTVHGLSLIHISEPTRPY